MKYLVVLQDGDILIKNKAETFAVLKEYCDMQLRNIKRNLKDVIPF